MNASVAVVEHDRRAANLMSKMTVCALRSDKVSLVVLQDADNRRSQLMNQYLRDKTDETETHRVEKAKTRHTDLETKQHEDQLRHLEVRGKEKRDWKCSDRLF